MTKIVTISGFESHVYKEGFGYTVQYLKNTKSVNKNKNKLKKVLNSYNMFVFFKESDYVFDKKINDQKYDDIYSEKKIHTSKPFIDKKDEKIKVKKNTTTFQRMIGYSDGNEEFLKIDFGLYNDHSAFDTKLYLNENLQYYPLTFNKTRFHRRGGRISILNSYDIIQQNSFGVDMLKGFKGFALNSGVNNLKENNMIKYFITKNDKNQVYFEDAVISEILFNESPKRKLIGNDANYNLLTGEMDINNFIYKHVNKISYEPRYTKFNALTIKPFYDYANNTNNHNIKNSMFVAKNTYLNEVILKSKYNKLNSIDEEKIYSSFGRSYDNSYTNGLESISFYESLD